MNPNEIAKQSEINIQVSLNNEKHPVKIEWSAEDSGLEGKKESKAMMLAFWDKIDRSTMRIDLWTTEMTVEEMQFFTYEILRSMADSYERSTSDKDLSKEIREFSNKFGKAAKVLK